jgi:hypothetical protein
MNTSVSTLAYLDPGTGSLLLQAIVGGTAGVLVFVRYIWRSFRHPVAKDNNRSSISKPPDGDAT